ncbi:MAG: glycosyltransferase family 2 protein [Anaerolineales bacterium]|nr:glycosyltransferase family 2 protein [Anaerolineales bacterium]
MTSLSVVIPAYNEERGIAAIMQRVLAIREDLTQVGIEELELLVVDDGSRDQTVQVAADLAHNEQGVRLIQHQHNRGYGAALKTGFSNAKGDLIGFLDADGTYPPEFFPQLCNAAINGSDLVIGSRMSGTESKMPLTRKVGNLFFASLLTLIGRQHVSDSASGMRVFKRQVLERIYPLPDGLNLTPVMSTRAIHEGIRMTEVPIPYEERMGNSKLSVVRDGSIFLQSIIWTVLMYNPVRILGMVGLGGVVVAMLVGLGLVIARLSGITELGPWGVAALFAALVSGVTGISIFALGSTFNYLVSLFYKIPIKQGLFNQPLSKHLDRNFGWLGIFGLLVGLALGLVSVVLGVNGWEIARLWLYLLGSALFILVGVQLIIYWVLTSILGELSRREELTKRDLSVITEVVL